MVQVGEDPELSKPASVDASLFFSDEGIEALTEMTLSTNKELADAERLPWKAGDEITMPNWDGSSQTTSHKSPGSTSGLWQPAMQCKSTACIREGASIEVGPMQIQTFVASAKDGNAFSLLRV